MDRLDDKDAGRNKQEVVVEVGQDEQEDRTSRKTGDDKEGERR